MPTLLLFLVRIFLYAKGVRKDKWELREEIAEYQTTSLNLIISLALGN